MQTKTNIIRAAAAVLVLALAAGCGSSGKNSGVAGASTTTSTTLIGAGSTLVAPLVTQWQSPYSTDHGVTVSYSAIGSGGGIEQVTARTVDFGASDAPFSADQAKACKGCVQLPWALAATTVSYNLPGLSKPLRLSGPVVADLYLGTIKAWNARESSTSTRASSYPRPLFTRSSAATRAEKRMPSPTSSHRSALRGSRRSGAGSR